MYDHSNLAELGSSNPETQRMVELAKRAEQRSKEVRCVVDWNVVWCGVVRWRDVRSVVRVDVRG